MATIVVSSGQKPKNLYIFVKVIVNAYFQGLTEIRIQNWVFGHTTKLPPSQVKVPRIVGSIFYACYNDRTRM